jgi:hypothetical protein
MEVDEKRRTMDFLTNNHMLSVQTVFNLYKAAFVNLSIFQTNQTNTQNDGLSWSFSQCCAVVNLDSITCFSVIPVFGQNDFMDPSFHKDLCFNASILIQCVE